ncbi:MAG TPA: PA2169 family four-helix-bundle protein [Terriglobales bacterium]|jgi:uncharacterized protein (TIGR02284 family)
MADTNDVISVIDNLIETCKDGETGYAHSATIVSDPQVRSYFEQQAQERHALLVELKQLATTLGERNPDTSGSTAAVLHRAWFEAKADMGAGDESILSSVEQGEDSAKKNYKQALEADLPANVRTIIARQAQSVFAAHDTVRDMRDRKKAA